MPQHLDYSKANMIVSSQRHVVLLETTYKFNMALSEKEKESELQYILEKLIFLIYQTTLKRDIWEKLYLKKDFWFVV
tara:strand:+ start:3735 stop:3965 length:231 start_codon:yes stop_codon:yes gene_type:complete